jgi:hypothetical protein
MVWPRPKETSAGVRLSALVIKAMVLKLDEGGDLGFEIAGQEVVFEQDSVL